MDEDAHRELMSIIERLTADDRAYIAGLEESQVIRLHHGFGTYIRNQIRAGELRALFRWSRTQVPVDVRHFDDVTWPIVMEVWRTVKAPPAPARQ